MVRKSVLSWGPYYKSLISVNPHITDAVISGVESTYGGPSNPCQLLACVPWFLMFCASSKIIPENSCSFRV